MKCEKCGFENLIGAEKCSNCGLVFNQKKKKKTGLIIGVLLIIGLIGLFFFWKEKINKFEDPFADINDIEISIPKEVLSNRNYEKINTITDTLAEEYKSNKIDADKYIKQLAYSLYDYDKLDYKYKNIGYGLIDPNLLLKKAASLADSLTPETAEYVFKKITLADVKWDVKGDLSGINNFNQSVTPLVAEENDLSKLSKAILSSKGNFIVYYTTSGVNAITNDDAKKISDSLETFVSAYEEKYGLKFAYNPQLEEYLLGQITEVISFGAYQEATTKAEEILKQNNIETSNMRKAMPVFIIDTKSKNTGLLGMYMRPDLDLLIKLGLRFLGGTDDTQSSIDNLLTTYAFPFFIVSSSLKDFDNTKIILSHELFHHYQSYICGNGKYGECLSGNFTTETTANFAAAQCSGVNKTDTVINDHAKYFISNSTISIDKIGLINEDYSRTGYASFVFALNYAEVVKNGTNHLFNSMKATEPLKSLAINAGEDYKKAMILTAERNLTLDYKNQIAIAKMDGIVNYPENYKTISVQNNNLDLNINYSSFQYFYVDPSLYGENSQIIFKSNYSDLSLLFFIKENGGYKHLYTHKFSKDFVLNIEEFSLYDEVVFGVVNSSCVNNLDYIIEVKEKGILESSISAKDLNLNTLEDLIKNNSSFNCYQYEEDKNFYTIYQLKIGFDKQDVLNELYLKATLKIKDMDKNNPLFILTQKMVSGLLQMIVESYKEQFKYMKIITNESEYEYSVTVKITDNYYDAIKNNLQSVKFDTQDKIDVVKGIYNEGFICEYQK